MTVVEISKSKNACVSKVSVQVSEYSEANGGADNGTLYVVEVLFPDGTWVMTSHHKSLADAVDDAKSEAEKRDALLLTESMWPNRKVSA